LVQAETVQLVAVELVVLVIIHHLQEHRLSLPTVVVAVDQAMY
jgi:hypothetical protein